MRKRCLMDFKAKVAIEALQGKKHAAHDDGR